MDKPMTQTGFVPQSRPASSTPKLQFSVPCMKVDYENGKAPVFHEVFWELPHPGQGVQYTFHVANGWIGGAKGQKWQQEIKILKPDGSVHLASGLQPLDFEDAATPFMAINFFPDIPFAKPGLYQVLVSLNGQEAIRYPLVVRQTWYQACNAGA